MFTTSDSREVPTVEAVRTELQRISSQGNGPPIDAIVEGPTCDLFVPVERRSDSSLLTIVQLGSFWTCPEFLERLRAIKYLPLDGRVAPLLYAIREFGCEVEWVDPATRYGQSRTNEK